MLALWIYYWKDEQSKSRVYFILFYFYGVGRGQWGGGGGGGGGGVLGGINKNRSRIGEKVINCICKINASHLIIH